MTEKRRDQRQYDLVRQFLPFLFLEEILETVNESGDLYEESRRCEGLLSLKAVTAVCLTKELEAKTCHKMAGYRGQSRSSQVMT